MHRVEVPWTNKKLSVAWEHFVSKLQPGQRETWTAVITGPDAKHAAAEMVAALYDRSLDAYLPHAWPPGFGVFREDHSNLQVQFENMSKSLMHLQGSWPLARKDVQMTYRSFPADITVNLWGYMYFGGKGGMRGAVMGAAPGAPMRMATRRALANGEDQAGEQLEKRDGVAYRGEAKKALAGAATIARPTSRRQGRPRGNPKGRT